MHFPSHSPLPEDVFKAALRAAGHRITQPRLRVWQVLAGAEHPLSAYTVQDRLTAAGQRLEAATIYRVLQTLQDLQLAHYVHSSGGYVVCEHPQAGGCHHHIVCTGCGATAEFTNDVVHDMEARITGETGYRVQAHILEFSGLCAHCSQS